MYGTLTAVALAFIVLTILTVMVDRWTLWTQGVVKAIPRLPDKLEWTVGYALAFAASLAVCWRLQFDLFISLGIVSLTQWDGLVFTALIMSGGSSFLASEYKAIDGIPGIIRGTYSTFTSMIGGSLTTAGTNNTTETDQQGPP
jgi:hypothetical protein